MYVYKTYHSPSADPSPPSSHTPLWAANRQSLLHSHDAYAHASNMIIASDGKILVIWQSDGLLYIESENVQNKIDVGAVDFVGVAAPYIYLAFENWIRIISPRNKEDTLASRWPIENLVASVVTTCEGSFLLPAWTPTDPVPPSPAVYLDRLFEERDGVLVVTELSPRRAAMRAVLRALPFVLRERIVTQYAD